MCKKHNHCQWGKPLASFFVGDKFTVKYEPLMDIERSKSIIPTGTIVRIPDEVMLKDIGKYEISYFEPYTGGKSK